MRQSQLFTKTRKEAPSDEVSRNASLLIRAGFIHKEMAGVYALLPLGMMVLEKIKQIVREEMGRIGGQELLMATLQRKELWEQTNRWNDDAVDVWFKSTLKNGTEVGFGWSHEEPITDMMRTYLTSYRDLPVYAYQFQTKLRNELRAKSGIMRGREFIMKDMYSYSLNEEQHQAFYDRAIEAYLKVFDRLGIGDDTFVTFASGGAFTEYSHEFQTITDAGEDIIYINREKNIAINEEVLSDESLQDLGVTRDELEEVKTAEVGNIFNFGSVKSKQLGLTVVNEAGEITPVHLGSYGIGITRLLGVIVERFSDENGIMWPRAVSPCNLHLIQVGDDEAVVSEADALYTQLQDAGYTVLYDDRAVRPGEKFADSDLIGIPLRLVVSKKTVEAQSVEVKRRTADTAEFVARDGLLDYLKE